MKKSELRKLIQEELKEEFNTNSEKLYNILLDAIPEDTPYKDLAFAFAHLLKNEYGEHNIEPFLKQLKDDIDFIK